MLTIMKIYGNTKSQHTLEIHSKWIGLIRVAKNTKKKQMNQPNIQSTSVNVLKLLTVCLQFNSSVWISFSNSYFFSFEKSSFRVHLCSLCSIGCHCGTPECIVQNNCANKRNGNTKLDFQNWELIWNGVVLTHKRKMKCKYFLSNGNGYYSPVTSYDFQEISQFLAFLHIQMHTKYSRT